MIKSVLVACGTAIATSTVVAKKIEKVCKENGIQVKTVQCKASEAASKAKTLKPDAVVATTDVPGSYECPVIEGRAFLTNVNLQACIDELMAALRD